MQGAIEIRPVSGKREFTQFIDYPYDRNRRDVHWIPPLRIAERERLTPRKNPFFAHADVELLLAFRDGRVAGRIAAIDDHLHNQTHRRQHRRVWVLRGRRCRDREGVAGARGVVGERKGARGCSRAAEPVAARKCRTPNRRLRHRSDADDAAQPARVRRLHRRRRLWQGEGSLRVALRPDPRHRARLPEDGRARAEQVSPGRASVRSHAVRARDRSAARNLLRRLGSELGASCRRQTTSSGGWRKR